MAYQPQAGTIPARVLAHLQTLPAAAELATAPLNEALGFDPTNNLKNYCTTAIEAGLIVTRRAPGERWLLWSLGDGKPLGSEEEERANDTARVIQRTVTAPRSGGVLLASAPARMFADESPQIVVGGYGSPPPLTDGLDIDAVHRTRDDVIEMETPQQGANRDASAEQSHDAEGSASPTGRGTTGASACGAAPSHREAASESAQDAGQELKDGHAERRPSDERCDHGARWENACALCDGAERPKVSTVAQYVEAVEAAVDAAPLPRARAGTAPARWGISNDADGNAEFHLQKAGALISLDVGEFREMCAFLDRMGQGA